MDFCGHSVWDKRLEAEAWICYPSPHTHLCFSKSTWKLDPGLAVQGGTDLNVKLPGKEFLNGVTVSLPLSYSEFWPFLPLVKDTSSKHMDACAQKSVSFLHFLLLLFPLPPLPNTCTHMGIEISTNTRARSMEDLGAREDIFYPLLSHRLISSSQGAHLLQPHFSFT